MNVLNVKQWEITDPIPTEENIDKNFILDYTDKLKDYTFVNYNLAESINKIGIDETQIVINQIVQVNDPKKLIWTCQHISVNELGFWGGRLFTPHATKSNKAFCIPHFPVNVGKYVNILDKKNLFSFRGSFDTHNIRRIMADSLSLHKEKIVDTGAWHFDNSDKSKNLKSYIEDLESSKIILCPRGTGPSTIRLWESLASGCIPLVISNDYVFPLADKINWQDISIVLKEEHVPAIDHYLRNFDDKKLSKMQKKGKEVFNKWFSPNSMHHIIYEYLKEE